MTQSKPNTAVVVRSRQLFPGKSLELANLGNDDFLGFLLRNLSRGLGDLRKIYAMTFDDLQEIQESILKRIEGYGFEVFIGDNKSTSFMLRQLCRRHNLTTFADIETPSVLVSPTVVRKMLENHLESGRDLTMCHNLPNGLAPYVVQTEAIERYHSNTRSSFLKFYGVDAHFKDAEPEKYYAYMMANATQFTTNYYQYPIEWQGQIDLFADDFKYIYLNKKEKLDRVRNLVYRINREVIEPDDVITNILIDSMKRAWTQRDIYDTKYIVADQATMSTPEAYDQASERETRYWVQDDPKFIKHKTLSDKSILEIGCGFGRLLRFLAKDFGEVRGIDGSEDRYFEARFRARNLPNVQVFHGDGHTLSQFSNEGFDYAFCHGVFVHINSKTVIRDYIREAGRVVKKGGRFKFDVYFGKDVFGITARDFGIGARYTEDEIRVLLTESGFETLHVEHVFTRQFSRRDPSAHSMPIEQLIVTTEKR